MTIFLSRRELLALPAALAVTQDTTSAGRLFDPGSVERRDAIVAETANDATVQAAERRLACPCPCTLDVFTCRTTDFTCTFSPERHKEVVALVGEGKNEDQVVAAMVERYGEEALMAPRPQGFNLIGYVFPASVILGLAAVIVSVIALRKREVLAEATASSGGTSPQVSEEERARIAAALGDLES
jgi:cytochrome c-type biogenesis protein CcmH/NrfF